ncbi:MAG: hypothetical protein O7A71_11200 [Chloroflexi bacterium]|nr:hypothetical protein [Chloroflexota bacterium]
MKRQITIRRLAAAGIVTVGLAALVLGIDLTDDAVVLIRGHIANWG